MEHLRWLLQKSSWPSFTGSFIIPGFSKQFKPSKEDIDEFVGMVMEKALIVRGSYSTKKIADDPTDDMF